MTDPSAAPEHRPVLGFSTVAVVLAPESDLDRVAPAALRAATLFGARLLGVYVIPPFDLPRYSGGLTMEGIWREQRARAMAVADAKFKQLSELAAVAAVPLEWRCLEGVPAEDAIDSVQASDVTVLEQDDIGNVPALHRLRPEQVARNSGRPIVVMPRDGAVPKPVHRILVLWDQSPDAIRSMTNALPLLTKVEAVAVLPINAPSTREGSRDTGQKTDVAHFLASHGVQADLLPVLRSNHDASLVLETAAAWQADLIVLGLDHRLHVRDLIFGALSRQILERSQLPVMFSA